MLGDEPAWEIAHEQTIELDVQFQGTLAETVTPAEHEGLDDAVRQVFANGVVKWESGRSPVRVFFDRQHTQRIGARDLVIGATVEILHEGRLARQLDLWWPVGLGEPFGQANGQVGWVVAFEDEQLVPHATSDGGWEMRVRSDPAVALRAGPGSTYWKGDFRVPLAVNTRSSEAPPKYWWRLR